MAFSGGFYRDVFEDSFPIMCSHQRVSSDVLFWHNSSANNANIIIFGRLHVRKEGSAYWLCISTIYSPNLHKFAYVKKIDFFGIRKSIFLSPELKSTQNSTPNSCFTHQNRTSGSHVTLQWFRLIMLISRLICIISKNSLERDARTACPILMCETWIRGRILCRF